jgi:hypothetical protein
MSRQLLFMVGFVIITLLKLEPMARNSVPTPTHNNMPASSSCTLCEILNEPELVVAGTGGNTCGSIKLMAAREINGSAICATLQKEKRLCCPVVYENERAEPEPNVLLPASHHYDTDTSPRITQSTAALESEVLSSKTPNNIMATVEILPCDVKVQQLSHRRCSSYDNVTNTSTHLFIYNPSNRDKFLCNAKLIMRPKSVKPLTHDDVHNKCGGRIDLMHEIAFRSHSFPQPPTMENRHPFLCFR